MLNDSLAQIQVMHGTMSDMRSGAEATAAGSQSISVSPRGRNADYLRLSSYHQIGRDAEYLYTLDAQERVLQCFRWAETQSITNSDYHGSDTGYKCSRRAKTQRIITFQI